MLSGLVFAFVPLLNDRRGANIYFLRHKALAERSRSQKRNLTHNRHAANPLLLFNILFCLGLFAAVLINATAGRKPEILPIRLSGKNQAESVYLPLPVLAYGNLLNKVVRNS